MEGILEKGIYCKLALPKKDDRWGHQPQRPRQKSLQRHLKMPASSMSKRQRWGLRAFLQQSPPGLPPLLYQTELYTILTPNRGLSLMRGKSLGWGFINALNGLQSLLIPLGSVYALFWDGYLPRVILVCAGKAASIKRVFGSNWYYPTLGICKTSRDTPCSPYCPLSSKEAGFGAPQRSPALQFSQSS